MTLAASMGLQGDLTKMREETGAEIHQEEVEEAVEATSLDQAVDVVADALTGVESAVATAASMMVPSADMVSTVMESVSLEAPTVDLSLPTQCGGKK